MTRPASTVTTTRHPCTVGAFASAFAVGLWGFFVPGGQSGAIDQALPASVVGFYYAALGFGGAAGLAAMCLAEQDDRARAERAAWYIVGWFGLFYALAAFAGVGKPAGQAAIIVGAYSPVATWRIVQISRERRRARRDIRAGHSADPSPPGVAGPART